eukprot:358232-Chlamydomonas_euryale.AAC.6
MRSSELRGHATGRRGRRHRRRRRRALRRRALRHQVCRRPELALRRAAVRALRRKAEADKSHPYCPCQGIWEQCH